MRVGWLGAGRMGTAMVERLLQAGHEVVVWNRTSARTEPLVALGAVEAESLRDATQNEFVFSMLSDDAALDSVTARDDFFAEAPHVSRRSWIECSTVSVAASERAKEVSDSRAVSYLCAPVSGNPSVVRAGNLIFGISGEADPVARVQPLLLDIGRAAHVVGDAHQARVVKLCTNLLLSATAQALAEVTILGEASGVPRAALLGFINDSAVGSAFTAYKGQAFVDLDFTPTFTPEGQRKDIRLGLAQAAAVEVPMPLMSATEVAFSRLIASGLGADRDFGALLLQVASDAGLTLTTEPKES